jgi:hypothetical protein
MMMTAVVGGVVVWIKMRRGLLAGFYQKQSRFELLSVK